MSMAIEKISTLGMTQGEWEQSRMHSIGGSDAACVVGLNPFKSPYALWAEKSGAIVPEDISKKEAVRLGHYLEGYVADRFTEETGLKVRKCNAIIKNSDYPFAHANIDRAIIGAKAGLECKTTSALNLKKFKGGEYPATYYCQCMHYMAVTGYDTWYLAVLIGNQDFRWYEIKRDEEEIKALVQAEEAFWAMVEAKTPPAVDGLPSTAEALAKLHGADPEAPEVDLTPVCGSLREYLALKEQVKALEARMEVAVNAVKEYMGSATRGSYEGMTVKWSQVTSQRFDKAAFQKNNPGIDLSGYHKATVSRRFEVKENT